MSLHSNRAVTKTVKNYWISALGRPRQKDCFNSRPACAAGSRWQVGQEEWWLWSELVSGCYLMSELEITWSLFQKSWDEGGGNTVLINTKSKLYSNEMLWTLKHFRSQAFWLSVTSPVKKQYVFFEACDFSLEVLASSWQDVGATQAHLLPTDTWGVACLADKWVSRLMSAHDTLRGQPRCRSAPGQCIPRPCPSCSLLPSCVYENALDGLTACKPLPWSLHPGKPRLS